MHHMQDRDREFFNEGVFRNGECDACERRRYESQPELLEALDFLLAHTLDADLAVGNELDEHQEEPRQKRLPLSPKPMNTRPDTTGMKNTASRLIAPRPPSGAALRKGAGAAAMAVSAT